MENFMKNMILAVITLSTTLIAKAGVSDIGSASTSRDSDVAYVQSVSDCFVKVNQAFDDLLKKRSELERQVLELDLTPGSDLSQKLNLKSQLMGAQTAVLLEQRKHESALSSGIYSDEAVQKIAPYCASHGVVLKTQ